VKSDRNLDSYKQIEFLIGKLRSTIRYTDVTNLSPDGLRALLQNTRNDLYEIAGALNHFYFNYY
jgi:hypothetical protein